MTEELKSFQDTATRHLGVLVRDRTDNDFGVRHIGEDQEQILPTVSPSATIWMVIQVSGASLMVVKCPDCGLISVDDDPEDVALHAKEHAEVTAPDRPEPNPRIAAMVDPESGLLVFKASDPDFLHEKLYRISHRFKREMKYDQSGWAQKGRHTEPGAIGALFCDQEGRTLGGAGIYTETPYRNVSHMIGWIWIALIYRRNGVLSRALPDLAKRFPGALISRPYSEAMNQFAEASSYITKKGGWLFLIK